MSTLIRVVSVFGSRRRETFHKPPEGVTWQFLDASTDLIDGLDYDPAQARTHSKRPLTRPEIGCYCSHIRAWRELLADPSAEKLLVAEDDVFVDWPEALRLAQIDWSAMNIDFLKLVGRYPAQSRVIRWQFPLQDRHLVQYVTRHYGTQLYIITRRGAELFLSKSKRITRPIDVQMERPWSTGVPVVGIVPAPALELSLPSSIPNRVADRDATVAENAQYYAGRVVEHARANFYRYIASRWHARQWVFPNGAVTPACQSASDAAQSRGQQSPELTAAR